MEISRMRERLKKEPEFIKGVFTNNEIEYCEKLKNKSHNYAARYAAKEAVMKALGTGWRDGIKFSDIEIINNDLGKPEIVLSGVTKDLADRLSVTKIDVSISHIKEIACAFVVLSNHK